MTALVRAAGLAGYEDLARKLDIDIGRELRRAGISARSLADPDALIPYTALMRLLEQSAQVSGCPDFGLQLSEMQSIDILGPLAVLMRHAATLGQAMQLASHYVFVHSPAIRFTIAPAKSSPAHMDLSFEIDIPNRPPCAQTLELSLGVIVRVARLLAPRGLAPLSARFPHPRVGPREAYQRSLGCICTFEVDVAAIRIAADDLNRPLAEHNALLQEMAQGYLDQHFGSPDRLLTDRVRDLVRRFLGSRQLTQAAIAGDLSVHPRTLQRRLEKEGATFEGILDDVRRERLQELLGRPSSLSLTQVALILGYSEQAALTRSCRRWFGCTPTALRKRSASA